MIPTGPYLYVNVIKSPLFRASAMSHPCSLGVYVMPHHIMSPYSIHICISFILFFPFWPPFILSPSPPKLSQSLPFQSCTLCSDKGSRMFVPQYQFPIIPGIIPSIKLLFSLMLQLMIVIVSSIASPILSTSAHLFQKNDLEGSVSRFYLPFLFSALDWVEGLIISLWLNRFMFVVHRLDGPVMQQIVPLIPRCVWDVFRPH